MGIATGNDVLYHNSIDRLITKHSLLTDAENLCDIALDGEILASSMVLSGAPVRGYLQVGRRKRGANDDFFSRTTWDNNFGGFF